MLDITFIYLWNKQDIDISYKDTVIFGKIPGNKATWKINNLYPTLYIIV